LRGVLGEYKVFVHLEQQGFPYRHAWNLLATDGSTCGQEHDRSWSGDEAIMKNRGKASRRDRAPDEIDHLRRNFGKKSLEELPREMERSVSSITIAAHALSLTKMKRRSTAGM
jgi:hypothetical protein